MKRLLFLTLAFSHIFCFAQKEKTDNLIENGKYLGIMPWNDNSIKYAEIVQVDSTVKAADLYNRAKRFFVETYKSANDVIQLDDKDNGQVIGKGLFQIPYQVTFMSAVDASVYHTITIWVKDGRYRFEVGSFSVKYHTSGTTIGSSYVAGNSVDAPLEDFGKYRKNNAKKLLKSIDARTQVIIAELKQFMMSPIDSKKDW